MCQAAVLDRPDRLRLLYWQISFGLLQVVRLGQMESSQDCAAPRGARLDLDGFPAPNIVVINRPTEIDFEKLFAVSAVARGILCCFILMP